MLTVLPAGRMFSAVACLGGLTLKHANLLGAEFQETF